MSQFFYFDHEKYSFDGEVYLVGGPVRDHLLAVPAHDRDWLVVGSTPEQMKAAGFVQVGKDFPVFLHPESKEEYALARTERKSGKGYQGFVCYAAPEVTLEEDLMRRDFTINAMAMDENGQLYDPYQGRQDLDNRLLRHVSPAFAEDPLRVLRGARFLARFHRLGFSLAPETALLMQQLVQAGELEHLSAERVWSETERALGECAPEQFFITLQQVGALPVWFPELQNVTFTLPEFLTQARHPDKALLCWGWLLHQLPEADIESLCQRIKAPKRFLVFARLVREFWPLLNVRPEADAEACLLLLERGGAFRQGGLFDSWLQLWSPEHERLKHWWQQLAAEVAAVSAKEFAAQGLKGPAIGAAIKNGRLERIGQALEHLP